MAQFHTDSSATHTCIHEWNEPYTATRAQNLLDLLVTDPSLSVTGVRVDDAGLVSDHRLVAGNIICSPARSASCSKVIQTDPED